MRRTLRWVFLTVFLTSLGASTPVSAHPSDSTTFRAGWQERTINYYFSGASWSQIGNIRQRVVDGAGQWSNRPGGGGFRYMDRGSRTLNYVTSCPSSDLNINGVFWVAFTPQVPGQRGETRQCVFGSNPGRIISFNIRFKGDLGDWYTGTGHPANAVDFWSYTSHELGHGTGFFQTGQNVHWEQYQSPGENLCPPTDNRETMCSVIPPETGMMRSPGFHDGHTFDLRYD